MLFQTLAVGPGGLPTCQVLQLLVWPDEGAVRGFVPQLYPVTVAVEVLGEELKITAGLYQQNMLAILRVTIPSYPNNHSSPLPCISPPSMHPSTPPLYHHLTNPIHPATPPPTII